MAQEINIASDLYDLLSTHNFDVTATDERGQDANPSEAKVFKFDWVASSGKNYGTAVLVIGGADQDGELMLFYGDNLGKSMEEPDKTEWFQFMQQLSKFATRHNFHTFAPKNLNALKHTMTGMAAIKEGLFEGYYGTRRVSYMGEQTDARLVIKHNRVLGENDKRYRYVESLFIETADGERFKLPFTKLVGGRAMLEHVKQGGKPYDVRGVHIAETVQELSVLSRFNRASQSKVFEGFTQQLVEQAHQYYQTLQANLKHLGNSRGYKQYFESWTPAEIGEQESLVEDLKTMFIEQTLDTRIEAALPTLAKIKQGAVMKEANEFESWVNNLSEGSWALPDTPEAKNKLSKLLANELMVGPDASNATEQLYDIFGDDQLFDRLQELAKENPDADARPIIMSRMKEIGLEIPEVNDQADQNVAEGDNLATFESGATVAGAVAPVEEGIRADYTRQVIDQILDGELDAYDVMNRPQGPAQEYVAMILQDMYDDVALDHRLHPDDDFEQILDIVVDRIEKDYRHSADQGVAENLDSYEFHTSVPVGKFLPSKFGNEKYLYLHDATRKSGSGTGPMLVTVDSLGAAKEIANEYDGRVVKTKMGTYRIVKDRNSVAEDSTDPMDHRGAVTDSFYEDLDRLKKLAFVKRT